MKRQYHCKLVRDKIPDVLREKNIYCQTVHIDDYYEKLKLLKQKLLEEVIEFIDGDDVNELVDIWEVIAAIASTCAFKFLDFEKVRTTKLDQNGGFHNGTMLIYTEEEDHETQDR
jgi:predicted house-cleaning noncanonical NTP pyrophosphatase (MazG superfamily)